MPDLCHLGLPELDSSKPIHNLKDLAKGVLDVDIQGGVHTALEDARVVMALFKCLQLDKKVLGWTTNPPCQLLDLQVYYDSKRCSMPDLCHLGLPELDSRSPFII